MFKNSLSLYLPQTFNKDTYQNENDMKCDDIYHCNYFFIKLCFYLTEDPNFSAGVNHFSNACDCAKTNLHQIYFIIFGKFSIKSILNKDKKMENLM